ncbi:uncharacterized protein LOC144576904 [Callithrix jacchus]
MKTSLPHSQGHREAQRGSAELFPQRPSEDRYSCQDVLTWVLCPAQTCHSAREQQPPESHLKMKKLILGLSLLRAETDRTFSPFTYANLVKKANKKTKHGAR